MRVIFQFKLIKRDKLQQIQLKLNVLSNTQKQFKCVKNHESNGSVKRDKLRLHVLKRVIIYPNKFFSNYMIYMNDILDEKKGKQKDNNSCNYTSYVLFN